MMAFSSATSQPLSPRRPASQRARKVGISKRENHGPPKAPSRFASGIGDVAHVGDDIGAAIAASSMARLVIVGTIKRAGWPSMCLT